MDVAPFQDDQTLRAQLGAAREKLAALVGELRAVDAELASLAPERRNHELLESACAALEELGARGAGALFWDEASGGAEPLHRARSLVDGFAKRVGEVEGRRESLLETLELQRDRTELLEDELLERLREEEERRQEWLVEREVALLPARALAMPWQHGGAEDLRFRKALASALLASLLLGVLIPRIELPVPELTATPIPVPERLARLILAPRPLPPPPPKAEAIAPPKEPPREATRRPPPETAHARASEPAPGPGSGSGEGTGEGAGKGPGKGILAFREAFSGVAEVPSLARLGARARVSDAGASASGRAERAMVTTLAAGSSGGINLSTLSRGLGGATGAGGGAPLAGVQIARATSTIAGGGGGGRASAAGGGAGNSAALGRSDEEIQIVFDRHKAALYRLYNRELRRDPALKGQMTLRLRIEPDGSVSLCQLHGTDMDAPQLASQVVDRVRGFDFGAKEGVAAVTILYPIDFLPAT